ncbi:MAG: hypothetical protein ATN36_08305 [Epulopiscium sp. Nele67-Bin005]|nr:MAG: hypothetical protein ATN36_08305 [Epulopiscium sp. Nele67-Bin005]
MNGQTKYLVNTFCMALFYIILGTLNVYSVTFLFMIPILIIPFVIYALQNENDLKTHILTQSCIVLFILLSSRSIVETGIYFFTVFVPAYTIVYCFENELAFPYWCCLSSLSVWGGMFGYFSLIRMWGIDLVEIYLILMETYTAQLVQSIETSTLVTNQESVNILLDTIKTQQLLIQYAYPTLLFVASSWITIFILFNMKLVGKAYKWKLPKMNELLNFKLSPISLYIAFLGFILSQGSGITSMLGLNIFFLINILYQFVGLCALIHVLKTKNINSVVYFFGVSTGVMLFMLYPTILIILGVVDTMFNYRKVDIVI